MQDAQIKYYCITKNDWQNALLQFTESHSVYAPFQNEDNIDYDLIDANNVGQIIYNTPKPVTPLKLFFSPVKQNVVIGSSEKPRIIMGVPACDLVALDLLDAIYMETEMIDTSYQSSRDNTLLIGSDCYSFQVNCHCTAYNINPYPEKNCDVVLSGIENQIYLTPLNKKGEDFLSSLNEIHHLKECIKKDVESIKLKRLYITDELRKNHKNLPNLEKSEALINKSEYWFWKKHSDACVSCGACASICPTCTCFLLIDRPDFEKIRQLDACQYPGFGKIAAGEDPLKELSIRFKNRYLCKYVWKPNRYKVQACTGCGRCIEACIGKINKNKILEELASL